MLHHNCHPGTSMGFWEMEARVQKSPLEGFQEQIYTITVDSSPQDLDPLLPPHSHTSSSPRL